MSVEVVKISEGPTGNMIPLVTQMYDKYKPLYEIPRSLAMEIADKLNILTLEITGSYRRATSTIGDFDIIVVGADWDALMLDINHIPGLHIYEPYMRGDDKMSSIVKYSWGPNVVHVKVDFFNTTEEELGSMLLYSTGSKEFNIKMRAKAKSMGYVLNQKGLFKKSTNERIDLSSEKDYFEFLKMEYLYPIERH